jgi:hypothetical protein
MELMCIFTAELLQVHLGDTPHNLSEKDFEDLARKTDGFSGSDVAVAVSHGPSFARNPFLHSIVTWSMKILETGVLPFGSS